MGFFDGILSFATFGLLGGSLGQSQKYAKRAAQAQQEANDLARRQQALEQAKERRQQIQQARIKQGQIVQGAVNQGALQSSSFLGGFGSVGTQANSNLGFLNASEVLSILGTNANNRVLKNQYNSQLWSTIFQTTSQVATMGTKG